jgi:hypothetical protein
MPAVLTDFSRWRRRAQLPETGRHGAAASRKEVLSKVVDGLKEAA